MKRLSYWIFALAALVFVAGLLRLARQELAGGAVYPEYSSLRADLDGTKLLYDALGRLPGITVERNFAPLSAAVQKHAAIFVIGVAPQSLEQSDDDLRDLLQLAGEGNRVIVAFQYERSLSTLRVPKLEKAWHLRIATDRSTPRGHPFFFRPSPGWTPVRAAGEKILAMEMPFEAGSLLLSAESAPFANVAVLAARDPELISQAVGNAHSVVFDETHLGIAESGSIVEMARRFRLMGVAAGLAVCALLFLWKNLPVFPPPVAAGAAARGGITAQAGLITLLRRHVPPKDLAETCWRAWLETGRHAATPERIAQAEALIRRPAAAPAETLRQAAAILQSKGTL